jgi:hypothetical protein
MVEVVLRPAAEYVGAGSSERAWLQISSDLGSGPQTAYEDIATASSAAAWTAGGRIVEHLEVECGLPADFAIQRTWTAMDGAMHALANRARYEEARDPRRRVVPLDVFIEDLLDVACGVLTAPMSEQTRTSLERRQRPTAKQLPI